MGIDTSTLRLRKPNTYCHNCNQPCYVRPNQLARQKTWFCNNDCRRDHDKKNYTAICELEFCKKPFRAASSGSIYCSRSCSNRARAGTKYDGQRLKDKTQVGQRQRAALIDRDGANCVLCNQSPVWNGLPLLLQIDHIDGNRKNNELDNLRLLCPNCHTQTDTWAKQK